MNYLQLMVGDITLGYGRGLLQTGNTAECRTQSETKETVLNIHLSTIIQTAAILQPLPLKDKNRDSILTTYL
jgi:hypothetical protein